MSLSDAAVHLFLIPAAAAGILALVAARLPSHGRAAKVAPYLVAFAVAAGFVVGLFAMGSRPAFPLAPSDDAWQWVIWLSLGLAGLAGVEMSPRLSVAVQVAIRLAVSCVAVWTVLRALHPHSIGTQELALRTAGFGVLGAAIWSTAVFLSFRRPLVSWLPALLVALGGAAFLLLEAGHSAGLTQATVVLATCVAVVAAVLLLHRRNPFPVTLAPVVSVTFVGLLAAAHGYLNYGSVVRWPLATAGALLVAPLAGLVLPRSFRERTPWIVPALVTAVIAGVVVALGAWFAPLGEE